MAYLQDMIRGWRLSGFRPILFLLLPIGECMAQEATMHLDLVGLQRRKVQVIMKNHSFSEYRKDHVTYVLGEDNYQRVNYQSDTCSSVELIVARGNEQAFKQRLDEMTKELSIAYTQENKDGALRFLIENRVRPKRIVPKKKNQNKPGRSSTKPVAAAVESEERKAADARYFTIQKRSKGDSTGHVKVLGWKK